MSQTGKVALVTGAGMGIGRAMTEQLLTHGAMVALVDINAEAGRSLQETLEAEFGKDKSLFIQCNVESEEQLKAAFQKTVDTFGGVDIVCNNAGVLNETEWEKTVSINLKTVDTFGGVDIVCNNAGVLNETEWEKTVSINLMGVIRVAYVALEHMSKQSGGRGGVIINTSSLAGLGPLPSCPVYTATKHAVIGFTRAMAMASLGLDYGVRFNALCPGFVDTHLFSNIPLRLGKFSDLKDLTLRLVHNFGIMKVGDVAQSLMELLSDHTRTGEALVVQPSGNKYAEFPSQA